MNNNNQNKLSHNTYDVDKYNNVIDDTYDSMVKESCQCCRKVMTEIEDIYVSVDDDLYNDSYICFDCSNKHNIKVVKCLDY